MMGVGEMPGDVEPRARLQRGLGLPLGHATWRGGADVVQEVQGEVSGHWEVQADVGGGQAEPREQQERLHYDPLFDECAEWMEVIESD